jgi:HPt (histidine-containing phosphotransfer) domain-containing protein
MRTEAMKEDNTAEELQTLNWDSLQERLMGDKELIVEVLKVFLDDAPKQLADMKDALPEKNMEKACDAAHSLRGSAGNIGAERLHSIARQIEKAARDGNAQKTESLLTEIMASFEELKSEIEIIISEQ